MAGDLPKMFQNFDTNSQDKVVFLKKITDAIRTTDVDRRLKDIVSYYDRMYGPDPATYSRNAQVPYIMEIRGMVDEIVSPPIRQGSGKRKSKKTKKSRRHRATRRRY